MALFGAGLGLAAAALIILTMRWLLPGLPMVMDVQTIVLTLLLAAFVGWVAGVRPAGKAASLKPIDALRSE